jgi:hypothetical protein
MERQTVTLPIFCGENILIHFVLNLNVPVYLVSIVNPVNPTPRPKYYGELFIYQVPPYDDHNPFTILKHYSFADNFIQIDPELKRITAKNFIAFLERIISILERIIYNNENPWLMLVTPTSESQSRPYYVNLKTKQTFWNLEDQDRRIHPWTNHADPHGRSYYVNSLTNETVWSIPHVQSQGEEEEPYQNTVLKQIIKCLRDINSNPDPTRLQMVRLIRKTEIMYREEKLLNKKITRVFIIAGHSMCGRRKFEIKDPRMCVMTLSKLNDAVIGSDLGISIFFSNILQTLQNPNSNIRSFMDVARFIRDKKIEYADKDQKDSIRVRCNDGNLKTTVTDQFFFGSSKQKYFIKEGVFMLTREDVSPKDISMEMLTPNPMKHLYTETTEFQKRIIGVESQVPESSFDVLKKHFESESTIFEQEWRNLQRQRMLFCISLNYGDEKISHTDVDGLCRGIDVMELQHYYDCIIEWENKNNKFAFDYFEDNEGGIIEFMNEYSISKDKKMEGKLMLLSHLRKQQVDYNIRRRMEQKRSQLSQYTDFQIIPPSYETKSCDEILQKIYTDYPEDNKLVIFDGCRTIRDSEEDPYHSENEEGRFVDTGGRGKRNSKNKRKNTSKKNKKINKNKNKKKNSIRIKK